jgi:hypothetical protein
MHFKHETLQSLRELAKDDKYGYVFDRLAGKGPFPHREVLERLAEAFQDELGVKDEKMPNLVFLLEMASVANREPQK